MNTTQLKRFAQSARTKLMEQVSNRLEFVLQTDSAELREKAEALRLLQEAINATDKNRVVEKVAYTWFNRLIALRFMDVNDFQPIGMGVVTPKEGHTLPEILQEAKHGIISDELPVNRSRIFDLLNGVQPSVNPQNEAYKYLLIGACNHLNKIFPFLFERINDYTELLMPDDLLSQNSIIQDVLDGMPEDDCREVEIIGWLYQFYISERKDEVFASKSSVKKEDIPAATQLFTPRWIVEYMVQNTVGKLWLQNRPNSKLREQMPYYIESASDNTDDFLKLNSIEELKLLDQACGSGHILVYGFELLHKIYEEEGYNPSDIPQLIIEKNLYGFEIDERASQLAAMALMMKARSCYRRFFRKAVVPNILCYRELKLSAEEVKELFHTLNINLPESLQEDLKHLRQATNFGSLIQPKTSLEVLAEIKLQVSTGLQYSDVFSRPQILSLIDAMGQLIPLAHKYHCVVANPPYMGGGKMNSVLSDFVKVNYPKSKADLFSCFIERSLAFVPQRGFNGLVTMESWMFLSSFEAFRKKILENTCIHSLSHFGWHIMRIAFGTVSFILEKREHLSDFLGTYSYMEIDNIDQETEKPIQFPVKDNGRYKIANQKDFEKIPGSPMGYWVSENVLSVYENSTSLKDNFHFKRGLGTGDNERYLRFWFETKINIIGIKWFNYNKGGEKRKWFGNREYIINWENDGEEIRNFKDSRGRLRSRPQNIEHNYKFNVSYSSLTSSDPTFRVYEGFINDQAGNFFISKSKKNLLSLLSLLNSKVGRYFILLKNQTLNITADELNAIPVLFSDDVKSNEKLIQIAKNEWNSRETSWDFQQNELIRLKEKNSSALLNASLEEAYENYREYWRELFFQLHRNEEELNRQFIEIYGLQDELTPDVPLEDITILKEETRIENGKLVFRPEEVMAQFVSYAVGCMFGRYSLEKEGLILANQGETLEDYITKVSSQPSNGGVREGVFMPDEDNIIPILDDEWFEDDITERFYAFLKASFGRANFERNLTFIEDSLGMDMRRYFVRNFYNDHIRRYKKRPIYWMFSSPKGSFNVLIYMHRYTPDTLNKVLNGYLHEFKSKVQARMEFLDHIIESGTSAEATKANKEKDKYRRVQLELQEYEREVLYPLATERISIDLDDGVLVNYNKFGNAIKEVAGLNDKKTKKKVKGFDWIDGEEIR